MLPLGSEMAGIGIVLVITQDRGPSNGNLEVMHMEESIQKRRWEPLTEFSSGTRRNVSNFVSSVRKVVTPTTC